jgi:hypothetical protein
MHYAKYYVVKHFGNEGHNIELDDGSIVYIYELDIKDICEWFTKEEINKIPVLIPPPGFIRNLETAKKYNADPTKGVWVVWFNSDGDYVFDIYRVITQRFENGEIEEFL